MVVNIYTYFIFLFLILWIESIDIFFKVKWCDKFLTGVSGFPQARSVLKIASLC